jgi:hypothetical protein
MPDLVEKSSFYFEIKLNHLVIYKILNNSFSSNKIASLNFNAFILYIKELIFDLKEKPLFSQFYK